MRLFVIEMEPIENNVDGEFDSIQYKGGIELAGFGIFERPTMTIVKKVVGNAVDKLEKKCQKYEKLSVHVKKVHEREKGEKYELKFMLIDNGIVFNSEIVDRNVLFALGEGLGRIDKMISK